MLGEDLDEGVDLLIWVLIFQYYVILLFNVRKNNLRTFQHQNSEKVKNSPASNEIYWFLYKKESTIETSIAAHVFFYKKPIFKKPSTRTAIKIKKLLELQKSRML